MMIMPGLGQVQPDFTTIDRETYRFYLEQKWDSLISLGNKAVSSEIDYYYLRMRMGIAWYSKKNYRKAAPHFEKALEWNQGDATALEYLYLSRLQAGQYASASLVRKQFRGDLSGRYPPAKEAFFDRLSVEYLYQEGVDDALFRNPADLYPAQVAGIQSTTGNFSNLSVSLVNRLAPGVMLSHGYTYLSKSNHYFYSDGSASLYLEDQSVTQHQYYLSPGFTSRTGWTFRPMVHLLRVSYQTLGESGLQFGNPREAVAEVRETDWAAGTGIRKATGTVDLHFGAWYSSLNLSEQLQGRIGLTWFPLGNLNLYAGGYVNGQFENIRGTNPVDRWIPEVLLGGSIAEKVWIDLAGSFGEMTQFLENNGMFVYNSFAEVLEKKATLTFSVPVTRKGSLLYLGARWTAARSDFYAFDPQISETGTPVIYNAYSIYGGITWIF